MLEIHTYRDFVGYIKTNQEPLGWNPYLFKIEENEFEEFIAIAEKYNFQLVDTIQSQLSELASISHPSIEENKQITHLGLYKKSEKQMANIGNWVLLPWNKTIVHLLEENDFFEVVSNRNQNKITKKEQQKLKTKTVGVIGLSVGAEAAVTIAQENLCGELRIADFDNLDLTNLNRVNSGINELGLAKTTIAARRIKSLNPYLKLKVYDQEINENNLNQFLNGLDLVVEECDHLAMKYTIRKVAKEKKVNLIYGADECGFYSIEPYQKYSNMPLFHGLITAKPKERKEYNTKKDFMKALCKWLGGWENISAVSRESVLQIGDKLCGYPQLASEIKLVAAQIGHISRRLLLGEDLPPLYGNIDFDKIIIGLKPKN